MQHGIMGRSREPRGVHAHGVRLTLEPSDGVSTVHTARGVLEERLVVLLLGDLSTA